MFNNLVTINNRQKCLMIDLLDNCMCPDPNESWKINSQFTNEDISDARMANYQQQ